jgi:hypothetical protein
VARDRSRDETLDLATDVLVMGGEPSAGWAALDVAAASARINSTGASGQTMAVLDWAHRQHPTDREVYDGAGLDHARHWGFWGKRSGTLVSSWRSICGHATMLGGF